MTEKDEIVVHGFVIRKWHPLTELPEPNDPAVIENNVIGSTDTVVGTTGVNRVTSPALHGLSAVLIRLLWDILCYLYCTVSVRIKRLGISARAFEQAKIEGCEKRLIFESAAGQVIYLIPYPITFEAFNMQCLYDNNDHIEHSFYCGCVGFLLGKDPRYKSVHPGLKRGNSGAASDIVTVAHDGTREAWEVTLSTTNILTNACKYENTDFARIVFLCRDYRLREAVKACCREGGLNPDLLAKLEYMHFSQLLQRQRKLSLY
jgi:hypothetical protein